SDAAIASDRSALLSALNADEGSGAGDYANTGDSQEAGADYLTSNLGTAGAAATEAGGDGDHLTEAGGTGDQLTGIASVGAVTGGINTGSGTITTLDGLDTAQDGQHATTQAAIAAITTASGGSGGALNYAATGDNTGGAIKTVTFVGTENSGTYASTEASDDTRHQITAATNDIDIVYSFNVGGGSTAVEFIVEGYIGSNDDAVIQAYDFVGTDWETLAVIDSGTSDVTYTGKLLSKHTGTGSDVGSVLIRIDGQNDDSSPQLNVDQIIVSAVTSTSTAGYANASVWVDEANGTSSGTSLGSDGIVSNRSDDFDNAQDIADALVYQTITIATGNSITLSDDLEGYQLLGRGSTLAFGSQNVGGSIFREFGSLSGVGTTTGAIVFLQDSLIRGATTLPPFVADHLGIGATLTIGSAGDFDCYDCYSLVAGAAAPTIDMGAAVGATTLQLRRWSGGLTLNNVATGDVVSVDAVSGGTITINGTGGTVHIRGMVNVTDGSSGSVTIVETNVMDSRFDGLNDLSSAEVTTAVEASEVDVHFIGGCEITGDGNATPFDSGC
ncbi:MAG: hypothetical protein KDA32_13755, partial [Phycisphaerales bacterium]|nr:hypothetical protein [Phycisphaerales bacterium]